MRLKEFSHLHSYNLSGTRHCLTPRYNWLYEKKFLAVILLPFVFAIIILSRPSFAQRNMRTRTIKPAKLTYIELPSSNGKFFFIHKCPHQQYNLSLEISPPNFSTSNSSKPSQSNKRIETIGLLFGVQDTKNYYRLTITPKSAALFCTKDGVERNIITHVPKADDSILRAAPTQHILIKRRMSLLTVVINWRIAIEVIESTFHSGLVAIEVQGKAPRIKKNYQPTGDIYFADDFMQTQRQEQTSWTTVMGEWSVESIKEEVEKADIRRSSNPFSFKGRTQRGTNNPSLNKGGEQDYALVTAGYDFWDNYHFKAAVKSHGGAFGIAFYYRSEGETKDEYYLLRCEAHLIYEVAEKVQLLRIQRNGQNEIKREVIAEAYAPFKVNQWYELAIMVMGHRIKAYIDKALVFDVLSDKAVCGGVGLYAEGEAGANFDDITVKSYREYQFDYPDVLKENGKIVKGKWSLLSDKRTEPSEATDTLPPRQFYTPTTTLLVEDSAESVYLLGDPRWTNYAYHTRLNVPNPTGAVGLIFAYLNDSNYLLFRWGDTPDRSGREQLVQVVEGKSNTLCDFPHTLVPDIWHDVKIVIPSQQEELLGNSNVENRQSSYTVKIYVDGVLEIRCTISAEKNVSKRVSSQIKNLMDKGIGRVGLYALNAEGCRFATPTVEFLQSSKYIPETTLTEEDEAGEEKKVSNEIFATDVYMTNWASPRGAWVRAENDRNTYWHKSDFFGDFSISVPFSPGTKLYLAADIPYPDRSYQIKLAKSPTGTPNEYIISLKRLFRPLLKKSFKVNQPRGLNLIAFRDGKYVWVNVGDTEIITYRDEKPLNGSIVGISIGARTINFANIHISRSNVKDYLFESAPVDWIGVGNWEVTNRFSCDPRWSWFGGGSRGLAVIWNKFDFGCPKPNDVQSHVSDGSFTLEFYASMRMNLNQTPLYRRPGDMNATICADGKDLTSGYTFILSGWGTKWTRMLRKGKLIPGMETDKEFVPTVYDGFPPSERLHRRWFYIKIRKIGPRIEYYLDNERIFTYDDPNPLKGRRIAIWTQDNSIMIARVKISYKNCNVPVNVIRTANTRKSQLTTLQDSQRLVKARRTLKWSNPSSEQGALIDYDSSSPHGGENLHLININSGGTFGVKVPLGSSEGSHGKIVISRISELSFDYKMPPEVKINLYLKIRSSGAEKSQRYFIHFTGRTDSHENLKLIGNIADVKADNQWHHASFDIASAAREAHPYEDKLVLEELLIGNFHGYYPNVGSPIYLNAGFGGNGAGVSYNIANFQFTEAKDAPITVADVVPTPGSNWGDSPIYIHFTPKDARTVNLDLAKTELIVNGTAFPITSSGSVMSYAWHERILKIDLGMTELKFKNRQKINLSLKFARRRINGNLHSKARQRLDGTPTHYGSDYKPKLQTYSWSYIMNYSMDTEPPSLVKVNGYLVNDTFEDNMGGWTRQGVESVPVNYNRMRNSVEDAALIVRDSSTAASGNYSLKLFNERIGGIFGAVAYNQAYSAGKYPLLSFDYKFSPIQRTDIVILNNGQWRRFAFTDTNNQSMPIFHIMPTGIRDGEWHHAEVNIRKAITAYSSYSPDMLKVERIVFGDLGWQGMPEGTVYHIDNFNIIPAVSARRGIELTWQARDPSGIEGYGYFWSKSPTDIPDEILDTHEPRMTFTDISEGDIYLHIRAKDRAGNWGETTHYKFMVDNSPPELGKLQPANRQKAASIKLHIPIVDKGGSGVDPSSLKLNINDASFTIGNPAVSYDAARQVLSWDWTRGRNALTKKSFEDGEKIRVAMAPIRDFAGNESKPFNWYWIMDHSKDKEPPTIPSVNASGHRLLCFDTFSEGLGQWSSRGEKNPVSIFRYWLKNRGDYVLQIVNLVEKGTFSTNIRTEPFDAAKFPIVSFDYKIPQNVKICIAIKVDALWYVINITSKNFRYTRFTTLHKIVADRKWHSTHFDLSSILKRFKRKDRRLKDFKISAMIMCDFSRSNSLGANYYIDNFAISSYGSRNPTFRWESDDLSGIAGYSFILDRKSNTVPDAKINTTASAKTFHKLRSGMWYLHVRARDRAGNWGPTVHYPYFVRD